jgi:hypothetical protein
MRASSYVWNSPSRPLSIYLAPDVIDRLGLEAMEAFRSVPRRGLEIGGMLLGSSETRDGFTTLYIHGYEPVESEHRSGPSYRLSETDLERLDDEVRRHPDTVGIYRTHTRSEDLELRPDDTGLFHCFFKTPDRVFLLVHPMKRTARFFVPEGEDLALAPAPEFPFQWSVAGAVAAMPVAEPAPAVAEAPPRVAEAPPPVVEVALPAMELQPVRVRPTGVATRPLPPPTAFWNSRSLVPLAIGGVALAIAGATLMPNRLRTAAINSWRGSHPPLQTAATVAPPPVTLPPEPEHIDLNVRREGRALRLVWDRQADAVRQANRGVLFIADGDHRSQLDLDRAQLTSGIVSYWPETQDITFRLEMFGGGAVTSDVVRVIGGIDQPGMRISKPASATRRPFKPAPVSTPPSQGTAARSDTADIRPSPFAIPAPPPKLPDPVVMSAAKENPVSSLPMPPHGSPNVSVVAEPVGGSSIGRVVGKIPLLRRLRKQHAAFKPPAPIKEFRPVLNAEERRAITRVVPVDVKVYVAESGKVEYVEPLSTIARAHRDLASAAMYAARRWDFEPARVGDEKVPGEVILHFRFSPVE